MKISEHINFRVLIILLSIATISSISYFSIQKNSASKISPPGETKQTPVVAKTDSYVYLEYLNTNTYGGVDNGLVMTLKIHDNIASTTKNLITFRGAEDMILPASLFSLYRNTIYFVNEKGQLSAINPSLTEVHVIPVALSSEEFISDYLFDGDSLYYLAGPFCNMYKGRCDGTLRVFNLKTEKTLEIVRHINKNLIAGFDITHSSIFFVSYFGDAGCMGLKLSEFNLFTHIEKEESSFHWCYDEVDNTRIESTNFLNSLTPKRIKVRQLQLSGNVLQNPTKIDDPELSEPEVINIY